MKDINWYRQALEEDNPDWVEEIYRAEVALGVTENENIPVTREERDIKRGAVQVSLEKAGFELEGTQGGFEDGEKQYRVRMDNTGSHLVLESMDVDISLKDLKDQTDGAFVEFDEDREDIIENRFDFVSAAEHTLRRDYQVIRKGEAGKAEKEVDRALDYTGHNPMGARDTHKPSIDMKVFEHDPGIDEDTYENMLEEAGYSSTIIEGENAPEMYGRMIEHLNQGIWRERFSGEDSEFFP